jgi:hypothetical protein
MSTRVLPSSAGQYEALQSFQVFIGSKFQKLAEQIVASEETNTADCLIIMPRKTTQIASSCLNLLKLLNIALIQRFFLTFVRFTSFAE